MSKTACEIKQEFRRQGITVVGWAEEHGFSVYSVRAVLSGHNQGNFGKSHDIAVALGLKDNPK